MYASPLTIDSLYVPSGTYGNEAIAWLADQDLELSTFDYQLWTDGSGHSDGYGAAASVWQHCHGDTDVVFSANYGQTVARNEFMALLDGLQSLLTHALAQKGKIMDMPKNAVSVLTGADRITAAWFTDRQNLALSTVFNEDNNPVYARNTEKDLWARYAWLTKYICVLPFYNPRNSIKNQASCDAICTTLRGALLQADDRMKIHTIHTNTPWHQKPQKALT